MVEKIIINPNKVRGYGNIMSPHSSSDYEVYMSSISSGTDTVNGQTMTVYEMEDTILFWDKAVTGMKNTKWWATGTLNITTSSDGTLVKNENSSGYSLDYSYITDNFPSGWSDRENAVTCYTRPFIVEFDLVSVSSTSSVGLYIGNSSANVHTYFTSLGITGTGHVRIEVSTTQVKCYLDETLVSTNNLSNSVTTSRVGFRINAGNNFKYKNFIIYEG